MKRNLFSVPALLYLVIWPCGCSKGSAPDNTSPSTGSGSTGGSTTPSPVIVKTMGVNAATVLMDSTNRITYLNITNGFGNTIKFQPGNTLQLELANANAEPRTEIDRYVSRVYYSNVRQGDVGSSLNATAGDSAANVFFRVRGFDYSKTGFHQLNVILCQDGVNNPGIIALGYTSSTASAPGPSLLTSQALKTLFNTKLDRIQLVIGGVTYY